ncbi:MAG: glycosyltransferase [Parvularculaceae bacterium]
MKSDARPPAKVLFPYVGVAAGGSHVSSLGLIQKLDRARYEPVLALQHMDGAVHDAMKEADAPLLQAPASPEMKAGGGVSGSDYFRILAATPRLARFVREGRYAIVHGNDGLSTATWALAAKLAGAKLVWHNRGNPRAAGLRFVAPLLADRVVSVSAFASPRPGLVSAAGKNAVVHSPFDVDVDADRVAARDALATELRADPRTLFVGFFGNLIARKRPLLFVDAVVALRERLGGRPVKGLLFGAADDGVDDEVRARAAAAGAADDIHLMGFRKPGATWIAACDILLVPAVEEPFGRTLIEAMLVRTPIVATDSGGNPEAIRHEETGLIAPPEDAAALADAMARLAATPDLAARLAEAARADALQRFGEDRHAEAIMAIYKAALAGR